ncbi:MAG TPA: penicillin-binding protein activator [bacterium]|nr:penicillin-binding protein activator [bacterium]
MKKGSARALGIGLMLLAFALLPGAVCQRTVIREGIKVPVEQAQREDMEAANQALNDGRYDDAIAAYERFNQDFPGSPYAALALVRAGEAYYKQGDFANARGHFQEVMEKYPQSPEALDAAWGLCLIAFSEKDCGRLDGLVLANRGQGNGRRWDQMTMFLAECEKTAGDAGRAFDLYAEESRQGRDEATRDQARAAIETIIPDVPDERLEPAADKYQDGFPGDLALLTLVRRNLDNEKLDQASAFADRFAERFSDSSYFPEFQEIKDLLERRIKVKPNRIGVMLPLSGDFAAVGEQALKGMMLAAKVFDEAGAIFASDLIIRDTAQDRSPEDIVDGLVNDDHVIAIVGPLRTSVAERAGKEAQKLGVPIISLSPGENVTLIGSMVYQNCLSKSEQMDALADYAVNAQHLTSIAALYPNDNYSREFFDLFARAVSQRGGSITAASAYDDTSTDFKQEIRALKAQQPSAKFKAIFIPDSASRVAMIAPQLRYYNLRGLRLLGMNGWHSPELLSRTQPDDLEGAVFTDGIAPEANKPVFNNFARRYRAEFNETPGIMEAQAYESVDLLLNTINRFSVKDRDQLKQALDHIEDYPGALGAISVDQAGKWKKKVYLYMVIDGEFSVISD